jgi:SEN1 N terminal
MTDPGKAPRLPDLLTQISSAHASPDEEELTAASILSSILFLSALPPEIHWLCTQQKPSLLPVVAQAVQLWGYGEPSAQQTLATFKPLLTAALARCPACAVEWQTGLRRELTRVFAVYSYDEDSTEGFFAELEKWDVERLVGALDRARGFVERVPMGWKHIEVRGPLVEVLAQPRLLLRKDVWEKWRELVLGFERIPAELGDKWFPGGVILVFDEDERIVGIGEKMFKTRDAKIGTKEFETEILKPLSKIVASLSQQVRLSL